MAKRRKRQEERAAFEEVLGHCLAEKNAADLVAKVKKPPEVLLRTLRSAGFARVRKRHEEMERTHAEIRAAQDAVVALRKLGAMIANDECKSQLQACVKVLEVTGGKTRGQAPAPDAALAADIRRTLRLLRKSRKEPTFGQYRPDAPPLPLAATPQEGDAEG